MHYAFHANAKNSTRLETIANVSTLDIVWYSLLEPGFGY